MTEVINFAAIAPQKLTGGDLFGNYVQGKKLASAIAEAQANAAYKQKQAQNYEQELASKMAYEGASGEHLHQQALTMAKALADPLWNLKPTGDVANAAFVSRSKQSENPNAALNEAMEKAIRLNEEVKRNRMKASDARLVAGAYSSAPAAAKLGEIALYGGMGVSPQDASAYLREGISASAYAKTHGIDAGKVKPVYPLTAKQGEQLGNRTAFGDEIKVLSDATTKALSPYGAKVGGVYVGLARDAMFGGKEKEDKVAAALGAQALQPELAGIRTKMMGGQVGIGAIREMMDAALSKAHFPEILMTPTLREKMNVWMENRLQEAASAFREGLTKTSSTQKDNSAIRKAEKNSPEDQRILEYNMKKYNIKDPDEMRAILKMHGERK